MARFSHGQRHAERRRAVVEAIGGIDPSDLTRIARQRTAAWLVTERVDAAEIGCTVPTESIALALAVDESALGAVVVDTRAVVKVIGRNDPSSPESDGAVERLLRRFARHRSGPVAAVSLLYQNHDATAALTSATIIAEQLNEHRRSAVTRTVRMATTAGLVGTTPIEAGQIVNLDLESSGLELGAGQHECPGYELAVAIVDGIVQSLHDSDYQLVVPEIAWGPDRRPRTLPMTRTSH
jgi:hypothetical protein